MAAIRRLKVFPQLPPPRPNPGEGANLRMIVLMRRAELRAGTVRMGFGATCGNVRWRSAVRESEHDVGG